MKPFLFSVTLLVLVFSSCKKKNEEATLPDNTTAIRQAVIQNIGDHLILPSYQEFRVDSDSLKNKCRAFCSAPGLTTLTAAQDAWKKAKLSWKRCEAFNNFGPGESLFIYTAVDYPTINVTKIESNISTPATPEEVDSAYLETRSSTAKGLTTLEYLLFDRTDPSTIVTNYSSSAHFENRKQYLIHLSENLYDKASLIYGKWSPEEGNYLTAFKSNPKNDSYGSLSLLINGFIQQADVVKTARIGIPLGKPTGTVAPAAVEAYYSRYSFECIKANLTTVQYIMTGTGYGTMNGNGIKLLMTGSVQKQVTYNAIVANLTTDLNYIESIPVSLEQAAQDSNADVEALYNSTKSLITLLKGDMCPQLNISVTFSDADGD